MIRFNVNNKFNVFLSFRGKDVRETFVDHLYESLSGAGLKVFLDSKELKKGKDINSSLQTAVETSDILIPIFSRHYAESTWCLRRRPRCVDPMASSFLCFMMWSPVMFATLKDWELHSPRHSRNITAI
ncbi:hypothetical protein SUGI_0541080 [Cryptomeria japonica]|nr:hypothetical protein SUGI_0541080 [Cryptomeria japonica]